jgi:hypothetical protein
MDLVSSQRTNTARAWRFGTRARARMLSHSHFRFGLREDGNHLNNAVEGASPSAALLEGPRQCSQCFLHQLLAVPADDEQSDNRRDHRDRCECDTNWPRKAVNASTQIEGSGSIA